MWTQTGESLCDGSSLAATADVRAALPGALRELGVRTLLDVPCGDWNWMSRLDLPVDSCTGGDLVPSVVEANRLATVTTRTGSSSWTFASTPWCTSRSLTSGSRS